MEMLLTLPFVLVLFALVVDMGYGFIIKTKTNTAARFAGTSVIRTPAGHQDHLEARRALERHFGGLEVQLLRIENEALPGAFERAKGDRLEWGRFTGAMFGFLGSLSSRESVELQVSRHPPVGAFVTSSPVNTFFVVDDSTWTHDDVPLTLAEIRQQHIELDRTLREDIGLLGNVLGPVARFLGGVVYKGLFWLLGIEP